MSSARDQILGRVRQSLNRAGPLPDNVASALAQRLAEPQPNWRPPVDEPLVERFVRRVESVNGAVIRVSSLAEVAGAVLAHIDTHGLAKRVVVSSDPELAAVPWSNRLSVERRAAVGDDQTSVCTAFAGVAETGSVVLLSSPDNPTTLNFLPEDHLVVLRAERVLSHIEDVWSRFRDTHPRMPRTVNFITGPSKTGDVEQTIQEGAHGPRRLCVILLSAQG